MRIRNFKELEAELLAKMTPERRAAYQAELQRKLEEYRKQTESGPPTAPLDEPGQN